MPGSVAIPVNSSPKPPAAAVSTPNVTATTTAARAAAGVRSGRQPATPIAAISTASSTEAISPCPPSAADAS